MLLGAAMMIALVRHRGDDAGLAVVPAEAAGCRRARGSPSARRRRRPASRAAIGSPSAKLDRRCCPAAVSNPVTASARSSTPSALRLADQRIDQRPVLDHVRERLARLDLAAEASGRSAAPRRCSLESVTTMSRIGCASPATASQTPMRLEQPPRRRRDRRGARVVRLRLAERRIGDRHRERSAQPLAQRDGQRQAGKAAAADQHVGALGRRPLHRGSLCLRHRPQYITARHKVLHVRRRRTC